MLATGKKLKKRLEELERRAGTSDDASSSGNEKQSPPTKAKRTQTPKAQRQTPPAQMKPTLQGQYTPPMQHDDEYLFPSSYDDRERSNTPPMFAYQTYPAPPEEMMMSSYGAVQGYRTMATEPYTDYLSAPAVSVSLPPMTHFSDAIKREPSYAGAAVEDPMPPYMSYGGYPVPGVDITTAGHPSPYDQMPHVSASSSPPPQPPFPHDPAPTHYHHSPPLSGPAYYHGRARC